MDHDPESGATIMGAVLDIIYPAELARRLGITRQGLHKRLRRIRDGDAPIPAEWVLTIEKATHGLVSRHRLRPDIYPLAPRAVRRAHA